MAAQDEERPIAMSLPAGSRHLCCLTRHHADLRLLNMSTGRVLRRWGVGECCCSACSLLALLPARSFRCVQSLVCIVSHLRVQYHALLPD